MDTRTYPAPPAIGEQLRTWRERRHLSQLALAVQAEVSSRHLSFIETGRAQPGRELILRLADELDIPLRERNDLLIAAGFAPVFQARNFEDAAFDSLRAIVDLTLERHKPFPAYLIDRHWNIIRSNAAVPALFEGVDAALLRPPVNVIRLVLHPGGMAPRILNLAAWRSHYLHLLRRQIQMTADPQLEALLRETLAYPIGKHDAWNGSDSPSLPLIVQTRLGQLSFIGATTVFGSPADVTLEEVALEVLHPADAHTEQAVQAAAAGTGQGHEPRALRRALRLELKRP
ncbi:helix-turn-helix domain-containing protein [Hylemonella gracilis]|uniref:Transcriptional regulator, XRE family protein n=1 Tax=Hylemonella gracilis ATCC 19624 TaxID=887062 RepID=F3KUH1_9BURK|nr:helix-turn-helix transcriptional regulator [Hylemonella gracilis]EGI76548.1 transcriptional regulator, XRE family protein [Hylemonella gracilis ATCC 19624]